LGRARILGAGKFQFEAQDEVAMNRKYKIGLALFIACQVLGFYIPSFANVHQSLAPWLAALLLVPGLAVAFLFPHASILSLAFLIVTINAVVWFFAVRSWPSHGEDSYWPHN